MRIAKLGFASPLTGPQAHYGKDNLNGAMMAVEELNARRTSVGDAPVKFELIAEDDQADPKTGAIVAQRLVDRRVVGVVGHFNSGVTIPASRIYRDAGIPQISVSTNPQYTRQGFDTAFRVMADDDRQGSALAEYAVRRLRYSRFAVVDDRSAYGQGLADVFSAALKAAGAHVVRREYTTEKDFDFRALLTLLRSANPDALFFAGYDVQAGPLARQMKELGMKSVLLGGETLHTSKFLELAGPAAEGHIASSPGAALGKRPRGNAFAADYRRRYGTDVGLYAPYFYDSVMVFAAAMQKARSTDPTAFLPHLHRIAYAGVTGDIEFDQRGNLKRGEVSIYRVDGGKWALQ